jgi:glutathione synthase/RimK-type ligase-like ATP-grasp enzyme
MTTRPTVLIVTARQDYTTDLVVTELGRRAMRIVRLDPADDEPVTVNACLTPGGWTGSIAQAGRAAALDQIIAVFWRWAWPPPGDPAITDPSARSWAAREDQAAVFGIVKSLPVRWVNHPDRTRAANCKPFQLALAKTCGFSTPRTLITHSGVSAASWASGSARPGEVLYKAFYCMGTNEGSMIPASRIEPAALPQESLHAASMFQQVISGQPIRTTVIGERAFSAAIDSRDNAVDWRPAQQTATYHPVPTPPGILHALHGFMSRLGLQYGAFDFIADRSGAWWFLEINPTGQYGFIETRTGLPLTAAIADLLCTPGRTVSRPIGGTVEPCPT